jgi:hypothetical protein
VVASNSRDERLLVFFRQRFRVDLLLNAQPARPPHGSQRAGERRSLLQRDDVLTVVPREEARPGYLDQPNHALALLVPTGDELYRDADHCSSSSSSIRVFRSLAGTGSKRAEGER